MHELPEFPLPVTYRPEVARELLRHGVAARPDVQPRVAYRFLRALMTFEIRDRKARRRELERFFGPQPLSDYAEQIEALRGDYFLLRSPLREWLVDDER